MLWIVCITLVDNDTRFTDGAGSEETTTEALHNQLDLFIAIFAGLLATLNLFVRRTRPYWWIACLLVCVAEIEDAVFSSSELLALTTQTPLLLNLANDTSSLSTSSFEYGAFVNNETNIGIGHCDVFLDNVTEVVFDTGISTALGFLGRLASFWAYPAVVLAMQQPARLFGLTLSIPLVFAIVNVLPLFNPESSLISVGGALTAVGIADKACYPKIGIPLIRAVASYIIFVLVVYAVTIALAVRAEWGLRSLFVIEERFHQKISRVMKLTNPFKTSDLHSWLMSMETQNSQQRHMVERRRNVAFGKARREAWELNASDLVLVDKIAAGAAAVVWKARYKDHNVAAKQFYSLVENTDEVAVAELAAEVHIY